MTNLDRAAFENMYARRAPWDIGRPQDCFIAAAHRVRGSILDVGCGAGDTALFFAARGHPVTGIDFLEETIRRAKKKAAERGLSADFVVQDALVLKDWTLRFDTVIDSGLMHVFSDENRERLVHGIKAVLHPGGFLYLACWSDTEPGTEGPRRISRQDLHDAFACGWAIESIQPCVIETQPTRPELQDAPYWAKAWFVVVQRT